MIETYLQQKRTEVLKRIKPICEAFDIQSYDYIITPNNGERLKIDNILIGCSSDSIDAIVQELVGYIFLKIWEGNRYLGNFEKSTIKEIKRFWIDEVTDENN